MKSMQLPILPIPNLVFFPNTAIPVFVAEPVYVRMIKDCIENNWNLGISMAEPVGTNPYGQAKYTPQKICGMGKPIVLEEHDDGSLKVLVKGEGKVTLGRVLQNLPYLIYEADLLHDIPLSETFQDQEIERIENILTLWTFDNIPDSLERETFQNNLTSIYHVIDYLSMFLIKDRHTRQLILENQSLFERIQILNTLLKGDHPKAEDTFAAEAIKDFEIIEKVAKVAH